MFFTLVIYLQIYSLILSISSDEWPCSWRDRRWCMICSASLPRAFTYWFCSLALFFLSQKRKQLSSLLLGDYYVLNGTKFWITNGEQIPMRLKCFKMLQMFDWKNVFDRICWISDKVRTPTCSSSTQRPIRQIRNPNEASQRFSSKKVRKFFNSRQSHQSINLYANKNLW